MKNRVGILGPFSYGNLGNAALQNALAYQIRRYFHGSEIYGCYINPDGSKPQDGIRPFPLDRDVPGCQEIRPSPALIEESQSSESNHRSQVWLGRTVFRKTTKRARAVWHKADTLRQECAFLIRALKFAKQSRILIVGLGGVLDDLWGGPWRDPYSLFKWAIFATLTNTPFVFMSVGAETIGTRPGRFFLKTALRLASFRSYRDEESKLKAERLGAPGPNYTFPDLAFSLEPPDRVTITSDAPPSRIVLVSPMAYCDPRAWPIKNAKVYQTYMRTLCSFILWLLKENYDVHLVATQFRMDGPSVQELKEMVIRESSGLAVRLFSLSRAETVDDFLVLASQARFVVSSRLHGVILPFLVNTPVLAVSHADKIDRLMEEFELSEYCVKIESAELGLLSQRAIAIEADQNRIRRQIRTRVDESRKALNCQFDMVFSPLVSRPDSSFPHAGENSGAARHQNSPSLKCKI